MNNQLIIRYLSFDKCPFDHILSFDTIDECESFIDWLNKTGRKFGHGFKPHMEDTNYGEVYWFYNDYPSLGWFWISRRPNENDVPKEPMLEFSEFFEYSHEFRGNKLEKYSI